MLQQLFAGGVAGAVARTAVAPIDRVKMLMQTQFLLNRQNPAAAAAAPLTPAQLAAVVKPAPPLPLRTLGFSLPVPSFVSSTWSLLIPAANQSDKYRNLFQSLRVIVHEEGVMKLWKGNLLNITRVFPYAAIQFGSYDAYKHGFKGKDKLTTVERLQAGALAGMTATTLTHPMDVIRLRLSIHRELHGVGDAFRHVWHEGGIRSLFKGYVPTMLSVSPFIAINFATFDILKQHFTNHSTVNILLLGAAAGLFAQSVCYPLDTVRRRQQMKGRNYNSMLDAFSRISREEGIRGLYRGMVPNAVKVVPNNAIRFVVFEAVKRHMGIGGADGGGGGS